MDLERRKAKAGELKGSERRVVPSSTVELRAAGDSLVLDGYASVTDTPYDMGWYAETIKRGAFSKTLSEGPDVQLLVNHEGLPLARTRSGTLQLDEDAKGLHVRAELDAGDFDVERLTRKMNRGDIDQMSFAFRAIQQDWNDDYDQRAISEVSIHRGDVSVVNQGANPTTSVSLRKFGITPEQYGAALNELRAGATLSASTMNTLQSVLDMIAEADEAVDAAQPLLAELMGVPNPDADDAEPDADDASRSMSAIEKAAIAEKAHRLLADLAA